MQHVLIIHDVEDFGGWKVIFDALRESERRLEKSLLEYDTDLNRIVHFSSWTSLDKARSFFESAALIEIRK